MADSGIKDVSVAFSNAGELEDDEAFLCPESEESSEDEDRRGRRRTDPRPPPPAPKVPKVPPLVLTEAIASAKELLTSQGGGPSDSGAAFSGARIAKAPPVREAKAANATHEAGGKRDKDRTEQEEEKKPTKDKDKHKEVEKERDKDRTAKEEEKKPTKDKDNTQGGGTREG